MNYIFQVIFLTLCFMHSALATQFLVTSDIHYGSQNNSQDGKDIGPDFLVTTLNKVKELTRQVDFILNLGDLPTHSLFSTAKKEEFERVVFHGLYEADEHSKPMFYITGNNDSLSGNYQPFELNGKSPLTFANDWMGACAHCKGLVIDGTHMYSDGYYSSYVIPNNKDILLIALNTIQFTKTSFLVPKYPNQEQDALQQLDWFEQQLKKHHGKQLLIAMHVPPGRVYSGSLLWHSSYLEKFITLLEKNHHFYEQITLLAGHTHMDEIRRISLKDNTAIYTYIIPAISRIHHNNSGMKIFFLNKQMAIKNFTTYYTEDLNQWGDDSYQALGSSEAIFPQCDNKLLSQCLLDLTDEQVCNYLEQKLFYGVKSDRVPRNVCTITYRIN